MGADKATRLGARPEKVGEKTAAKRPPRSPPGGAPRAIPWGYGALAALLPPRQADPPTADQAAPGAWGCPATPAERVYPGGVSPEKKRDWAGGRGPPLQGRGLGNHGAAPPPLSPPLPPLACGPRGRRPSTPPEAEGAFPLPPEGAVAPWEGRS